MRRAIAAILAASFCVSTAIGETTLSPGKPAGIKPASTSEKRELYIMGAVVIVSAGAAIALIGHHTSSPPPTSTSP
jgi:hypothetical protein